MTIEQMLMRTMKTSGEQTRGRGFSRKSLAMWIGSMLSCIEVRQAIEQYCDVRTVTSEQHVVMRDSRQSRDADGDKKLVSWLNFHSSYSQQTSQLIPLSICIIDDGDTNCDETVECGSLAIAHMFGKKFAYVKLKRNDKVNSLSSVNKCVKIRRDAIPVNPQQLFNRTICIATTTSRLEECLCYELSPYPPALFDEVYLTKTAAADDSFGKIFRVYFAADTYFVMDGGHLLHKVV